MKNEVKIGIFIIAALLVGFYLWSKTQNFQSGGTYDVKAYFNFANNLRENAVVTLSGIEAGRVKEINFVYNPETKVEIILSLQKNIKLHRDAIAYIDTSGFIGDALVGLTPGTSETGFLKNGDIVTSEDPVQTRELMKKADSIAKTLDATLAEVKELLEGNKDNIEDIIKNIEEASANFDAFSADLKAHPWKMIWKTKENK